MTTQPDLDALAAAAARVVGWKMHRVGSAEHADYYDALGFKINAYDLTVLRDAGPCALLLASLLRWCRERGIRYDIRSLSAGPVGVEVWTTGPDTFRGQGPSELDAALLALHAAGHLEVT